MFAGIFRTQTRLPLTFLRARTFTVGAHFTSSRILALSTASIPRSRLLSTSKQLWSAWPGESNEGAEGATDSFAGKSRSETTLYVGNIPFSASEDEIRDLFSRFGEIRTIRIAFNPGGTSRGFCHIEFANPADAAFAIQSVAVEPLYMLDRNLRVNAAVERGTQGRPREPSDTLYFHGFRGGEDTIRNITRAFDSDIIQIRFLKNRESGTTSGAGFIQFTSIEQATRALDELHNVEIEGNEPLFLRFATPTGKRSKNNRY